MDNESQPHAAPGSLRNTAQRFLNDRLDWSLLRTFLFIGQERSLSKAAARLYITQSAVSQALRRLEEQLDCVLVLRHGQRFDLTDAGEEILRIAADIYGNVSRIGAALGEHGDSVVGKVRLLSISRVEFAAYDDFLIDFHRRYPRVDIEVAVMGSADILNALQQRTATVGLGLCRRLPPKLARRLLVPQRYAFFCGRLHRFFGVSDLSVADLRNENVVSFTSDLLGGNLSPLAIYRDQHGLEGRVVAVSSSVDEVRRLVRAGYGIGCLPEHLMVEDVQRGILWRLPPEEGVADIDIHLLWNREQKMTAAEAAFLHGLQAITQAAPAQA